MAEGLVFGVLLVVLGVVALFMFLLIVTSAWDEPPCTCGDEDSVWSLGALYLKPPCRRHQTW